MKGKENKWFENKRVFTLHCLGNERKIKRERKITFYFPPLILFPNWRENDKKVGILH